MKKTALLLAVMMLIFSTSAYAAPVFSIQFNPTDASVTLTGNAEGAVTVMVTNSDTDISSLSDGNPPVDMFRFISVGKFTDGIVMPDNAEKGKYSVYVSDNNGKSSDSFIYYLADEAREILESKVNVQTNVSDYVNAVVENAVLLGIDLDHQYYSDDTIELMYNLYGKEDDVNQFSKNYSFSRAVAALNGKSITETENVLRRNENILGINFEDKYSDNSVLTESVKSKLCSLLSSMDYMQVYEKAEELTGEESFEAVYDAYTALAALSAANNWSSIKKAYTESFAFLKENIVDENSDYKSSISTSVFTSMADDKFDDISDIKDNFDKAVESVTKKPQSTSSPGGSRNSFATPPASTLEPIYETIPNGTAVGVSTGSIPTLGAAVSYTDVSDNDWYSVPVGVLGGSGIINGYTDGSFRPDNYITRAEFAKMMVSAFSVKGASGEFSDVAADSWYKPYVSAAAGAGIINGYDGLFRPDENITREDATVIIYRMAEFLEVEYFGYREPLDMNSISLYAWTAVATLYANGVISGVGGGNFEPKANITRAQAAQLIYNAVKDMQERI